MLGCEASLIIPPVGGGIAPSRDEERRPRQPGLSRSAASPAGRADDTPAINRLWEPAISSAVRASWHHKMRHLSYPPTMTELTASDYRGAFDVLSVALESEGSGPFSQDAVAALRRLIPSAIVAYHEWSPQTGTRWLIDGAADADMTPLWSRYEHVLAQDPLPGRITYAHGQRVAPVGVARRISDVLTLRQFRRLDLHAEMCRPLGIDHVMKLYLAVGDTGSSFVLDSQRRPFSERDRAILDLLAPHLSLIRQRHLRQATAPLTSPAAEVLTARQREILQLVASGMTNREVAAALYIAPGTVRKHLENVYAALAVRNRAQAIAATSHDPHSV
jgi:DNA-binding CsgD family transcriptional regulator